ncbi:MAG: hypothetical protein R3A46_11910 [Thermomicrobiales bacterium]
MLGWLVIIALFAVGVLISSILAYFWGRGANEGMSVNMESESASYVNFTRGQSI